MLRTRDRVNGVLVSAKLLLVYRVRHYFDADLLFHACTHTTTTTMSQPEQPDEELQGIFHDVIFTIIPTLDLPEEEAQQVNATSQRHLILTSNASNTARTTPDRRRSRIPPSRPRNKAYQGHQRTYSHRIYHFRLSRLPARHRSIHTRREPLLHPSLHREGKTDESTPI